MLLNSKRQKDDSRNTSKKVEKQAIKLSIFNQNLNEILDQCKGYNEPEPHVVTFQDQSQTNKQRRLYKIPEKLQEIFNMKKLHQQVDDKKYLSKIYKKAENRNNKQPRIRKVDLGEGDSLSKQLDFEKLIVNEEAYQKQPIFGRLMAMSKGNSKNFQFKSSKITPQISKNNSFTALPQIITVNKTFSDLAEPISNLRQQIKRNLKWADSGAKAKNRTSQQKKALGFLKRAGRHSSKLQYDLNSSLEKKPRKSPCLKKEISKYCSQYSCQLAGSEQGRQVDQSRRSQLTQENCDQQLAKCVKQAIIKNFFLDSNRPQKDSNQSPQLQLIAEKKQRLHENIIKKAYQLQVHGFVTKQRIQALYQCELLKGIKKLIGIRNFNNMHISLEQQQKSCDKTSQEKKQIQTRKSYTDSKTKSFKRKKLDIAQEALRKNRNRLKVQKKRVIEKLRF